MKKLLILRCFLFGHRFSERQTYKSRPDSLYMCWDCTKSRTCIDCGAEVSGRETHQWKGQKWKHDLYINKMYRECRYCHEKEHRDCSPSEEAEADLIRMREAWYEEMDRENQERQDEIARDTAYS